MTKTETVYRAITRAGLDPFDFNIYPSSFGQPVIIEKRLIAKQKIKLTSDSPDPASTLVIHTDDGIKRIAEQIKEKYLYHD
jgi:hypothetical protein